MRGAEQVAVGAVGFFCAHFVVEAVRDQELAHLGAAAELVDEALVQPGFVDFQRRVGEQAVAVEALDVVALEGAAVAPDVHFVGLHGRYQQGAGDGAPERRGVEVGVARGADVKGPGLQRRQPFGHELGAAVDQARRLGPVGQRLARNGLVVGFVGLAQVGGVGVGQGAFELHPEQGGGGVESARKGDADLLADGQGLQDGGHGALRQSGRCSGRDGR